MRFFLTYLLSAWLACVVSACTGETPPEQKFLDALDQEVESGTSYEELAVKILARKLPGQRNAFENIGPLPDVENDGLVLEKWEKDNQRFAEAIKARDCPTVKNILAGRDQAFPPRESFLGGYFLEQGICVKGDPERAAEIYRGLLEDGLKDPVVAARLGALYFTGEGVDEDPITAGKLFQQAALWNAYYIWMEHYGKFYLDQTESPEFAVWGLTPSQLRVGYATLETGPWELPGPLADKTRWVETLGRGDGSEIVAVARNLFHGTSGYNRDTDTAWYWMAAAAEFFGNQEAAFLIHLWTIEGGCSFPSESRGVSDCDEWQAQSIDGMEIEASKGNEKAILYMIDELSGQPKQAWASWGLYQHLLLARETGLEVNEKKLKQARNALTPTQQKVIEAWVAEDIDYPIRRMLPQ